AVDTVLIDASGNLKANQTDFNVYIDASEVNNKSIDLKVSIGVLLSEKLTPTVVVVNGLGELNGKLVLTQEELLVLLNGSNERLQFIFIDSVEKVGNSFGGITTLIRENIYHFLFGGDLRKQRFIENLSLDKTKIVPPRYVLHQYKDETFGTVNIPMEQIK
ncbi:type VII secretion protein EssC, partial [Lactococcus piscium]|nr:type VII secretion protein EssC [Lactococcus paracarnosus]MCJ1984600.1 type VII secretion protein EssC [Lactococcus paracarnosus]MCJ1999300.1 type VII secretion protein EssC [Lactococcus paracarnosus]